MEIKEKVMSVEAVKEFLMSTGMHPDLIGNQSDVDEFEKAMDAGLRQEDGSCLPMLPSFASSLEGSRLRGKASVIDAGGTNLRAALVEFTDHGPEILEFKKTEVPGRQGRISFGEFTDRVADFVRPYFEDSDALGYCFSFPVINLPTAEAHVLAFNKELEVDVSPQSYLCKSLFASLGQEKPFCVVNDSTAAMLSVPALTGNPLERSVGMILGTGFNVCYPELCANITKSPEAAAMPGSMAVNIEAASYDRFARGEADLLFDATTALPGDHQLEKMVAGAYFGGLTTTALRLACDAGLFSEEGARFLRNSEPFDTIDIAPVAAGGVFSDLDETDMQTAAEIIRELTRRAARAASVPILAAKHRCSPERPVTLLTEGSTINKSVYLNRCFREVLEGKAEIITKDDATVYGTAAAAITRTCG